MILQNYISRGAMFSSHPLVHPWQETEIPLTAAQEYANPYTDVELWADFVHSSGLSLRRPAFWDGGAHWKVRFASPLSEGSWKWQSDANVNDSGLVGQSGELGCRAAVASGSRFHRHGFWRMDPGGRNLIHADGAPALLVGDTAWALPWRATLEQCETYAADRHRKGFNAVLLMSVQPDMEASGPRSRTQDYGFDVGFEDLYTGHLNQPNVPYFQTLDQLVQVLLNHDLVPVYQPVFHGYGWKGKKVAGPVIPPEEYARYCRYLVARYGARPAIYLVGADGKGTIAQVAAGGAEVEAWDCYGQPTGMHYSPHAGNKAWQDQEWLDFQWCQTGHNGEHIQERLMDMWHNRPIKGVANGEPTYENIGEPGNGAGWWQGHEAWCNLCAGGTMGVVYGAGSLWQWKLHPDEPGHEEWCQAAGAGWREALDFEGSTYVGMVGKIFADLPFTGMEPNWDYTIGRRGLAIADRLLVVYLPSGGALVVVSDRVPNAYRAVNPKNGATVASGNWSPGNQRLQFPKGEPLVVIFVAPPSD
jgi:hypothetical protein